MQVLIALLSFSRSLASIANVFDCTKCISLNNQSCMNRPTLIDLNPNQHNQGLFYHVFMVNLEKCNGSCNTLDDLSGKMSVLIKTKNVNFFNIVTWKHQKIYYANVNNRRYNSNKKWNIDKCQYKCKNLIKEDICKKDCIWNPTTCTWENGKFLESIEDDSVVTFDEIIDVVADKSYTKKFWS